MSNDKIDGMSNFKSLFNLNEYELKILLALMENKELEVGKIGNLSGVPRSRCYDVLESLEREKFISVSSPLLARPIIYKINSPDELIKYKIEYLKKDLTENIEKIKTFKQSNEYQRLKEIYNNKKEKKEEINEEEIVLFLRRVKRQSKVIERWMRLKNMKNNPLYKKVVEIKEIYKPNPNQNIYK